MGNAKPAVLVVDDEVFNLDILREYLEDAGFSAICVESGLAALALLNESPQRFSAVLLDRMMPGMEGLEVLKQIKVDPALAMLPVIFQTALVAKDEILEGLRAGAYYYLTKPFDEQQLIAIVNTAVDDCRRYWQLHEEVTLASKTISLMKQGVFTFQSLAEAHNLATMLANTLPNSARSALGLSELLVNAVEHGNLGISYQKKGILNEQGTWKEEVQRRMRLPENASKFVTLAFERSENRVRFTIQDQGNGFDWQGYLAFNPDRAFDNHGRGIFMANSVSFDQLEYVGNGNCVVATVEI